MGLFQYNRLVFGITSPPAIWQRTTNQVLEGTSGTSCILDDIIITGKNDEEHLANLKEVLRRFQFYGLRANKVKCEPGRRDIDSHGLHKSPQKVEAVLKVPRLCNVAEVRSFLGLVNYYNRFLPNLSSVVHPLNQLVVREQPSMKMDGTMQGRSCLYAKYASAYQNFPPLTGYFFTSWFVLQKKRKLRSHIDEAIREKVLKVVQFQHWHFLQHSYGRVRLCVLYFLFQSKKPLKARHIFFEMYSSNNFL